MAECKECGTSIKAWEAIGGACENCYSLYLKKKALLKERDLRRATKKTLPHPHTSLYNGDSVTLRSEQQTSNPSC